MPLPFVRCKALLLLGILSFSLLACTREVGPVPTPTFAPGDPLMGRALFEKMECSNCHGTNARGALGPKIAGTTLSSEEIQKQVRNPRGIMKRFSEEELSDGQLWHIVAWLKSLE